MFTWSIASFEIAVARSDTSPAACPLEGEVYCPASEWVAVQRGPSVRVIASLTQAPVWDEKRGAPWLVFMRSMAWKYHNGLVASPRPPNEWLPLKYIGIPTQSWVPPAIG